MSTSTAEQEVARLLPPQLPALLLGQRTRYSHAPRGPTKLPGSGLEWAPSLWRREAHSSSAGPSRAAPTASGSSNTGSQAGTSGRTSSSSSSSTALPAQRPLSIALKGMAGAGAISLGGAGGVFCGPAKALRLWPFHARRKAAPKGGKKTVLIMMSNTGGGHKASAEALRQGFEELYGKDAYNILIVDMWKDHTPAPFNQLPDTYSFLVKHDFLWRLSYVTMQPRLLHLPYMRAVNSFVGQQLGAALAAYAPDLVVSVHPLMQHIPVRILAARAAQSGQPQVPFATVVTDFTTCHNTWFYKRVTKCFVPTEFTRKLALRMGLTPDQIVLHGLPIRPIFSKRLPPKRKLRARLGMDVDLPAILLVGGGEGMGKLEATVEQLDARLGATAQVVVICGRNAKLLARLRSTAWPGGMRVHAEGFVDNIHEWMGACDTIITKAGPGTIAEALISGLPILLNGNVPCQEEGNIPYVVDNSVGAFETDPAKIAAIMADWLGPLRAKFDDMARRSKALGRPEAVYRIVEDLHELAQHNPHEATAEAQLQRMELRTL